MANLRLSLETIGQLGSGTAEAIINKAIDDATNDVEDRGEDGKARKVVIELTMTKREDGLIEADVAAQAKLPARRTPSTVARPVARDSKATLYFQSMNPESPDQNTFPHLDRDSGEVGE